MPAKTPLSRPALPAVADPLDWPGESVAVFGPGALAWARELGRALPAARVIRVELRHAEGFEIEADRDPDVTVAHTHPHALRDALIALRERTGETAIGVGAAFALAIRPRRVVWITGGQTALSLPPPLQPIARAAHLALDEPRLETARALGASLSSR